ncbi:RmlC-like cupin domain-containing protein [Phanerochaete sordida]|uniref:RmlC-like cupin domain-containing protein n=1 Tax=Phanerochaete sordida TaxID=48140 RepID=A0A9P3GAR7_9APHY|nr:RmlC-like cupin domain-containing protein [Phanerochaete sordida]
MTGKIPVAPLASLRVTKHQIAKHGGIPNTSIHNKPLTIYHGVFPSPDLTASHIEGHLKAVGVCTPQWRYTMFDTTHFHSTTHELLVIASGHGKLLFGGEGNPGKVEEEVTKGDAILVSAGVGHRRLDVTSDFEMVGSYPAGSAHWDMCYGREGETGVDERIEKLGWFEKDPIYDGDGPAVSE